MAKVVQSDQSCSAMTAFFQVLVHQQLKNHNNKLKARTQNCNIGCTLIHQKLSWVEALPGKSYSYPYADWQFLCTKHDPCALAFIAHFLWLSPN